MTKEHLRCWASNLGIDPSGKTARRLRLEIQTCLCMSTGQQFLAETIRLPGVKAITQSESIGSIDITVRHAWWALPVARRNMRYFLGMRGAWQTMGVRYKVTSHWLWWRREHPLS